MDELRDMRLHMTQLRIPYVLAPVLVGVWVVAALLAGEAPWGLRYGFAGVVTAVIAWELLDWRRFRARVVRQLDTTVDELSSKKREERRLLRMIEEMPVAVMTLDTETSTITYMNRTCDQLLRQIEEYLPVGVDQVVGSSMDVFHQSPIHQRAIVAMLRDRPYSARITIGPEVLDLQVSAMTSNGEDLGAMAVWDIVTKEVAAEQRILDLALYDALTGLNNRATFRDIVDNHLRQPHAKAALLFVDLDGFKSINDTLGHHVGDQVIKQVAHRLMTVCGSGDTVVGRLGGDEFGVFIFNADLDFADMLAHAVIEALSAPYHLDHGVVTLAASVGIAAAPEHGAECAEVLARADIALYRAKAAGKGQAVVFNEDMELEIQERAKLMSDLRLAIEADEGIFVFFQDIVNAQTMSVTAREALARWHHPAAGWVAPSTFIAMAEESDLIEQLGHLILTKACREAAMWRPNVRLAVNVSARQLGKGTFVPSVFHALLESGLELERLEIEITETALLRSQDEALRELQQLRLSGLRVSLDDFGTGFSSLAHLRDLPFDTIKVDGSFVRDACTMPGAAAIVHAIAELGQRLHVTTVAEGVETVEQLELVAREGCVEVQGYLISRPAPSPRDAAAVRAFGM